MSRNQILRFWFGLGFFVSTACALHAHAQPEVDGSDASDRRAARLSLSSDDLAAIVFEAPNPGDTTQVGFVPHDGPVETLEVHGGVRGWDTPVRIDGGKGRVSAVAVPFYVGGGTGVGVHHWMVLVRDGEQWAAVNLGLWKYVVEAGDHHIRFWLMLNYEWTVPANEPMLGLRAICVWLEDGDKHAVNLELTLDVERGRPTLTADRRKAEARRRLTATFPATTAIGQWIRNVELDEADPDD